ncbi:heterokaryon incompatibility protein-domain-containing protein [Nemania sp. FL0031]|nr:heterokaryon incompatibility protein-domain-containing protein [Nemania sp. FL0031]
MSPPTSPDPCHCRYLHKDCNPTTCAQAKFASQRAEPTPLKAFRQSGERGCSTCATVTNALVIPEIRQIWRKSIGVALRARRYGVLTHLLHDEEDIRVELDATNHGTDRIVLRTRASDVSDDWRHFNIWSDGASEERIDDCRAFPALKFHPVEHTDSADGLEHLKEWMNVCSENHKCCPTEDPILPTRLLQVTEDKIRVVNTEGKRGRYTTLSHKWGMNEEFRLTQFSMDFMTDTIPWDVIPKTYQESIEVTRRLGIEYIWIDSLCIIQDDTEDWRKEAGMMKSVYGNSYLNIAAVQAVDSYGSLFASSDLGVQCPAQTVPQQPTIHIRPQPHMTHRHFGSNYYDVGTNPLLQRGWVLQERILSPRVVYYDTNELKWECKAAVDCQCGGMTVISNFKLDYHRSVGHHNETPLPYQWMRISERYSTLKFTYNSDRLVALAGIAEQGLQSGRGGKYLAGVWERSLAHQLCWGIMSTHKRPDAYQAPSWSWLSVFGWVTYPNRMDFQSTGSRIDVEILEATCTTVDGGVPTTSSSPVLGSLRVKGRGLRMKAELADLGSESRPPVYRLRERGSGREELSTWAQADYVMGEEEARTITEVLFLFWGDIWDQPTFLALRPAAKDSQKFERLGIVRFTKGDKAKEWGQILAYCGTEDNIVII